MSCGSSINYYDVGDTVKLFGNFTEDGSPVDPPTVVCKVRSPLGAEVTYTYEADANVVRAGTGAYECHISPDRAGAWDYRWQAIDPAAIQLAKRTAEEGRFIVRRSKFAG